jgi:hypothetical protein
MCLMRTLLAASAAMAITSVPAVALAAPAGAPSLFYDPNHQAAYTQGLRVAFDFQALPFPIYVCPLDADVTANEAGNCDICQGPLQAATHTFTVAVRRAGHSKNPRARRAEGWRLAQVTEIQAGRTGAAIWRPVGDRYRGYIAFTHGANEIKAMVEHPADGRTAVVSVPYYLEYAARSEKQR